MDDHLATKVMLVDNEAEFVELLSQRLKARGLKVISINSGEEAVVEVVDRSIDVAVVALAMPGIDGLEILRQILEKRPDLAVIMLADNSTVENGIEVMKGGAVDCLEKPVDLNLLMEAIRIAKENSKGRLEVKSEEAQRALTSKG